MFILYSKLRLEKKSPLFRYSFVVCYPLLLILIPGVAFVFLDFPSEIRAVFLDFPSVFVVLHFPFFPVETAIVFATTLPFFLGVVVAVHFGILKVLPKYF